MPIIPENPTEEVYVTAWYDGKKFGDGFLRPTAEGLVEFRAKCYEALVPYLTFDNVGKPLFISIPGGKA